MRSGHACAENVIVGARTFRHLLADGLSRVTAQWGTFSSPVTATRGRAMATQQSAQVYVTNRTDGNATITLFHNNSTNGTQRGTWDAAPGQRVGPLTVLFKTG